MLLSGDQKIYDWTQDFFGVLESDAQQKNDIWEHNHEDGGERLSETYVLGLDFPQGKHKYQTEFWQRMMNGASSMMTHTKFWQTDESDLI